jgi:hypothetical protein
MSVVDCLFVTSNTLFRAIISYFSRFHTYFLCFVCSSLSHAFQFYSRLHAFLFDFSDQKWLDFLEYQCIKNEASLDEGSRYQKPKDLYELHILPYYGMVSITFSQLIDPDN